MRAPSYLYFSLDEYSDRLRALRARMESRGIDALLIHTPENIYYVSGYQTPGYYWYMALVVRMSRAAPPAEQDQDEG